MNNITLFRKIGTISREAMIDMNKFSREYNLDNNLFLYLIRIVENPGISLVELTNLVKFEKSTISRALTKLEKLGYLIKETNPQNKKYILIYPTEKAHDIYKIIINEERIYSNNALTKLDNNEKDILFELLNKIELS